MLQWYSRILNIKRAIILVIYFVFFITINSFAETSKKHTWEINTETSYIKNKTMGFSGIPVLKSHSMMYGGGLSYTYNGALPLLSPKIDGYMLKIEGKGSLGKVDNNYVWDDTKEHILEFRGLAGYNFPISEKTSAIPYVGIGYRFLKTNKTGVYHEDETAYLYSPVGLEINIALEKKLSFGVKLEYDYFLKGEIHTNDNTISYSEYRQKEGYGLRGSVKLQKKTNKTDLIIEPFLTYWNIKESEQVPSSTVTTRTLSGSSISMHYPKNNSTEIGIRFAVRF